MNKRNLLFVLLVLGLVVTAYSQKAQDVHSFQGAQATLKQYKALYILNESDEKKVKGLIKNINNALNDPRLKGRLQIELIAFGDGVEIYRKTNHYDTLLVALQNKGVLLAQCSNTVRERHIDKADLWPFISYVPSGTGEIIIRQYQGWAIVHP